jgi:hypothetical protein
MSTALILGITLVLLIISLLIFSKFSPWPQFFVKGLEQGFNVSEIFALAQIASKLSLPQPSSLFWSVKVLNSCIKTYAKSFDSTSTDNSALQKFETLLHKLLEFRKHLELNLPKYKLGLTSSRSIIAGQTLKMTLTGQGLHEVQVLENNRKHLVISKPQSKSIDKPLDFHPQMVKVYFWRTDDAGYYFETKILSPGTDLDTTHLYLSHSDGLIRTQKRVSIRVGLKKKAQLFPLMDQSNLNETWTTEGGLACQVLDISETGSGVKVGGRGKVGLMVKLQVELSGMPIVLNGAVKHVSYSGDTHSSVLHIQAINPTITMRNRIQLFVLGISQEKSGASESSQIPQQTSIDSSAPPGTLDSAETESIEQANHSNNVEEQDSTDFDFEVLSQEVK